MVLAILTPSPTPSKDWLKSFEWPLKIVAGKTLSEKGLATPRTFRLIDCKAYLVAHILRVVEWRTIDVTQRIPYATISYVWKGIRQSRVSESFAVEEATGSDRVDIDVLRIACMTAVKNGADYLWLDQLCILQPNAEDKNYQIQNMATIFKRSHICLVLLGGIGGLVGEGDTTSWVKRSWTLQEALLPKNTHCIVKWTRGPGEVWGGCIISVIDTENDYAVLQLSPLISYSLVSTTFKPFLGLVTGQNYRETGPEQIVNFSKLFSTTEEEPLALSNTLSQSWSFHTLGKERETDDAVESIEELESTIWRCAITRTSTRELDAVFSTMGLFGIELNPSHYKTQAQALTALLQKSMVMGRRATWLATSIKSPGLIPLLPTSTFQEVPSVRTRNNGIIEARFLTENLMWYLSKGPTGLLDGTGALKINAPIALVTIASVTKSTDGFDLGFGYNGVMKLKAGVMEDVFISGQPGTHAIKLGKMELYRTAAIPRFIFYQDSLVMLVEQVGKRWKKVGMAAVSSKITEKWPMVEMVVFGDPNDSLYP